MTSQLEPAFKLFYGKWCTVDASWRIKVKVLMGFKTFIFYLALTLLAKVAATITAKKAVIV